MAHGIGTRSHTAFIAVNADAIEGTLSQRSNAHPNSTSPSVSGSSGGQSGAVAQFRDDLNKAMDSAQGTPLAERKVGWLKWIADGVKSVFSAIYEKIFGKQTPSPEHKALGEALNGGGKGAADPLAGAAKDVADAVQAPTVSEDLDVNATVSEAASPVLEDEAKAPESDGYWGRTAAWLSQGKEMAQGAASRLMYGAVDYLMPSFLSGSAMPAFRHNEQVAGSTDASAHLEGQSQVGKHGEEPVGAPASAPLSSMATPYDADGIRAPGGASFPEAEVASAPSASPAKKLEQSAPAPEVVLTRVDKTKSYVEFNAANGKSGFDNAVAIFAAMQNEAVNQLERWDLGHLFGKDIKIDLNVDDKSNNHKIHININKEAAKQLVSPDSTFAKAFVSDGKVTLTVSDTTIAADVDIKGWAASLALKMGSTRDWIAGELEGYIKRALTPPEQEMPAAAASLDVNEAGEDWLEVQEQKIGGNHSVAVES